MAKKDSENKTPAAAEATAADLPVAGPKNLPPAGGEPVAAADAAPENPPVAAGRPPGDGWHRVTVYWANADPDNRHIPIVVNCVGRHGKRVITPGVPVWLHERHLARLKDAVIETELQVPEGSGVYAAANPLATAEAQNPGMTARMDPATGLIYLVQRTVQYVISRE